AVSRCCRLLCSSAQPATTVRLTRDRPTPSDTVSSPPPHTQGTRTAPQNAAPTIYSVGTAGEFNLAPWFVPCCSSLPSICFLPLWSASFPVQFQQAPQHPAIATMHHPLAQVPQDALVGAARLNQRIGQQRHVSKALVLVDAPGHPLHRPSVPLQPASL